MKKIAGAVFAVIVLVIIIPVLMTLPLMWLWNWLMPQLFGLKELGFWQALGLACLSSILFKGGSASSKKESQDE